MKSVRESVLLKTSSNADVQYNGGNILITGLKPLKKSNITFVNQLKYKVAVPQVVTIGGTAYIPAANIRYAVAVYDPQRYRDGFQESQKVYAITTNSNILSYGATVALQREAISLLLVAKINRDTSNHATAASVGGGAGFTVTDNLDYYPVRSQSATNEKFVDTVLPLTNSDGSGFASTNFVVTTPGVVSIGVGAKLATMQPVMDFMYGNLTAGENDAPPLTFTNPKQPATSGQNYDLFVITSLTPVSTMDITGHLAYEPREQAVWVDNGSGTSTTNLAGFLTFEREMRKIITGTYASDDNTTVQWFDQNFIEQGPLGAVPVATASIVNKFLTPYGMLNHININAQTIVTAAQGANGLLLDQDLTATDGAAYTPDLTTVNSQQFIVGKTAMTVNAKASFTTPANIVFMVGFRSKEAHQAAFASYQYLATVGTGAAGTAASSYGNLAAGTPVVTAAGFNLLTTVQYDFRVQIAIDGTVSAFINNVKFPIYSVGTTALVIPANTILIPFFQYTNLNSSTAVANISEFWGVSSDLVIS